MSTVESDPPITVVEGAATRTCAGTSGAVSGTLPWSKAVALHNQNIVTFTGNSYGILMKCMRDKEIERNRQTDKQTNTKQAIIITAKQPYRCTDSHLLQECSLFPHL